jgi:hypothetical protein
LSPVPRRSWPVPWLAEICVATEGDLAEEKWRARKESNLQPSDS